MAWTAATWPCGSDRVIVTASPGRDQLAALQAASIGRCLPGSADKFARVSFFTLPPSR